MRMKTKQLWIIVSLTLLSCLPISVRADSVEGKAIICSRELDGSDDWDALLKEERPSGIYRKGLKFSDDRRVEEYHLSVIGSDAVVKKSEVDEEPQRVLYAESIEWKKWDKEWSLDRKTLVLTSVQVLTRDAKSYTCEVFNNFSEFDAAFDAYRQQEQELVDEKMGENRI